MLLQRLSDKLSRGIVMRQNIVKFSLCDTQIKGLQLEKRMERVFLRTLIDLSYLGYSRKADLIVLFQ